MSKLSRENLDVRKNALLSIIVNALQIAAMGGVFVYIAVKNVAMLSRSAELILLGFCLLIVIWGAVIDIRDALLARHVSEQTEMVEEAYRQLEDLNATLRCQRHDFMNHLQVVFSLTEMGESDEAMQYIERVYGDIRRVSAMLRTSVPAVNALLAAKRADCEERGILFETDITSPWSDFPVPSWEICRVLGNLIDNARDALTESPRESRLIRVALGETPSSFTLSVQNNGPKIPSAHLSSIFQMGFTTKSEGHGSGLSIVSSILHQYGGEIEVTSDDALTDFRAVLPKPPVILTEKNKEDSP